VLKNIGLCASECVGFSCFVSWGLLWCAVRVFGCVMVLFFPIFWCRGFCRRRWGYCGDVCFTVL